jgi:hypothetical protein
MYIPDSHSSKNGHERKADSSRAISLGPGGKRLFNDQTNPSMEPNLFLAIINALGFQATVMAIVFNWGDWKANLLFLVSFGFLCLRGYFYFRRQNQAIRREELEQEEMKRKMDDEIDSLI